MHQWKLFAQALSDNAELAKQNTRLIEESEALLIRCQTGSDAQCPSHPTLKKGRKGLFPFRKCAMPPRSQYYMLCDTSHIYAIRFVVLHGAQCMHQALTLPLWAGGQTHAEGKAEL